LASDQYLEFLSVEARIARYRELAEDALQRATMASDLQTRRELLNTCGSWHALANDLAKKAANPVRDELSSNAPKSPPDQDIG